MTIYEDFMCPVCGDLEAATRAWLPRYAAQGKVRVIYRPVAFLNRMSNGTEYSTRAANAYAVVLDEAGPEAAATFHDLLFDHQPRRTPPDCPAIIWWTWRSRPAQPSQSPGPASSAGPTSSGS